MYWVFRMSNILTLSSFFFLLILAVVLLAEPKKLLLKRRRKRRKKRWTWAEAWTCSAERRLAAATIKQILVPCIY
jgi:hypothetical protein